LGFDLRSLRLLENLGALPVRTRLDLSSGNRLRAATRRPRGGFRKLPPDLAPPRRALSFRPASSRAPEQAKRSRTVNRAASCPSMARIERRLNSQRQPFGHHSGIEFFLPARDLSGS
jgi:hypothetical protein